MLLPHRTLFCLLLGISAVQFVSSQNICSSNQRCEPESETFSLSKTPTVNSTCGSNPPYSFCLRTYDVETILTEDCSYVCNSNSEMDSHGPDKMTDGNQATWWQSESGVDSVSIEIALGFPVQIEVVKFSFVSFIPNAFYIEKSTDNGVTFEPFHYMAEDCMDKYMIDPDIENETGILCFEYDGNELKNVQSFVSRNHRPKKQLLTNQFYNFVTITNIRVILDEHYYSINQSDYYYALNHLSVTGHCQCNGHASSCIRSTGICDCSHNTMGDSCGMCLDLYNDLQWNMATNSQPFECKRCECNGHATACSFNETLFELSNGVSGGMCTNCSDNTVGHKCDECAEEFYPKLSLPVSSINYCQECGCNTDGTVSNSGVCQRFLNESTPVGQCFCKDNVEGIACNQCMDGYFNLDSENVLGCEDCGCDQNLSINKSCNSTGSCYCKEFVIGAKCDTCESGYYMSGSQTCSPCGCDVGGSLSNECHMTTGQCYCRNGVTGRTCREVESGRFFPFIDHYIFEAEDSDGGIFNFSYRMSGDESTSLYTGSGYALIRENQNIIRIGDFTPPIGGQHEFVLRYRLTSTSSWDTVELRLEFDNSMLGNGPPDCSPEYTAFAEMFFKNIPPAETGAVSITTCLRAGRTYSMIVNGFENNQPNIELEIDSLVILFKEPDGLASLSSSDTLMTYNQCVASYRSLTTINSTIKNFCEAVSFSVFTEIFNGTLDCACDPIGAANSSTCEQYGGQCQCKTLYNIGRQCEVCAAGSYRNFNDEDRCSECTCSMDGSKDLFCNRLEGSCDCWNNVVGDSCNQCAPNTFNLQPVIGCSECGCHLNGSKNLQCFDNGTCDCIEGAVGEKCTMCSPVNFKFPICSECHCDPSGSANLTCTIDGQCSCLSNTEGLNCSSCNEGTFNLHSSNNDGCQPCYCSGQSTECYSAPNFTHSQIETVFNDYFGWTIESFDDEFFDITENGLSVFTNSTAYLVAPSDYHGNQLNSYRQYIHIDVNVIDEISSGNSDGYDMLIEGKGIVLVANFSTIPIVGMQTLSMRFIEGSSWMDINTDESATAYQLQSVLINLRRLEIRISLSSYVNISSIRLDTAIQNNMSESEASWVEQCDCLVSNYMGYSCEQCSDGYTRTSSDECVLCECNENADICDKNNGICINCTDNTTGDHCELCLDGYYGDPAKGIPCRQCMCPLSGEQGQYSSTCELVGNNSFTCTDCAVGHFGDMCEMCEAGYFGNPLGVNGNSTKCTNCSCNENIDTSDPDSCSVITGICTMCLFNTTGNECEQCLYGFYGDPIDSKNCTDCGCNPYGSEHLQCNSIGECSCHSNVIGTKCDECEPAHYNLSSGVGCDPCDCHSVGAMGDNCDITTGQCMCKPNVTNRKCDVCEAGFYDLGEDGCKDCECGAGADSGSCNDDGICECNSNTIGDKCDSCVENYFISNDGSECNACPACYTDIQELVNVTRDRYNTLRSLVDDLAEQNDPNESSFQDKSNFIQNEVDELSSEVNTLSSQYNQLNSNAADVLNSISKLENNIVTLENAITDAIIEISPYSVIATSAYTLTEDIQNILFAAQDELVSIQTIIYPETLNSTSYINNITAQSNMTLDEIMKHVILLENQTNSILMLVQEAEEVAGNSLNNANTLAIISNNNSMSLNETQNSLSKLNADVLAALQELTVFNSTIAKAQMNITSVTNALPTLPSEEYIHDQQNTTAQLNMKVNMLNNFYWQQQAMLESLNTSLSSIQQRYEGILIVLNSTAQTVSYYLTQLNSTLDNASEASSQAYADIILAESVLADLQNFSNATAALKAKADEALAVGVEINKTVTSIEKVVDKSSSQVEGIRTQLDELLADAMALKDDSATLQQDSANLATDSVALSDESNQLLTDHTNNQATLEKLHSNTISTISEINNTKTDAEAVQEALYSDYIQSIPQEAELLSANASAVVSKLTSDLLTIPTVDEDFLNEVETLVAMIENEISTTDLSALYSQLLTRYNNHETMLNDLQSSIESAEDRVSRLLRIMESLPTDCAG